MKLHSNHKIIIQYFKLLTITVISKSNKKNKLIIINYKNYMLIITYLLIKIYKL